MSKYVGNELRLGEKFVGNHFGALPDYLSGLSSARLGSVALDIDGKTIPSGIGYRPLFIGASDLDAYDRIMMARFNAIRKGSS